MSAAQATIAAMISPALLILASASFIATALVRLARIVDRVRKLVELGAPQADPEEIARHRRRALLAEGAVSLYFSAAALFVVAGLAIALDLQPGQPFESAPIWLTAFGMVVIVAASVCMLAECWLAVAQIRIEMRRL